MIQTKQIIVYGDWDIKESKIKIDVPSSETSKAGVTYLVNAWSLIGDEEVIYKAKEVFYSNAKIDALNDYIEQNYDLTGLTKTQCESKKIQIGLMLDTQTNLFANGKTIFGLTPNDWEFSE